MREKFDTNYAVCPINRTLFKKKILVDKWPFSWDTNWPILLPTDYMRDFDDLFEAEMPVNDVDGFL